MRNLRQHTSEPWTSVAKKMRISCAPSPRDRGTRSGARRPGDRSFQRVDFGASSIALRRAAIWAAGSNRTGRPLLRSRSSGVSSVARYWSSVSRLPVTVRHQPQSFEVNDRMRGTLMAPWPGRASGGAVVLGERVLGEQDQRVEHVLAIDLDDLELGQQELGERQRRRRLRRAGPRTRSGGTSRGCRPARRPAGCAARRRSRPACRRTARCGACPACSPRLAGAA